MGFDIGGFANAYNGYRRGEDLELGRQQLEKDRAFQAQQRDFQAAQNARTMAEQGREDGLRDELSRVEVEREERFDAPADGVGPIQPSQKLKRYNDEIYADQAAIMRRRGKINEAMKLEEMATQIGSTRSARLFSQLDAAASGLSSLEAAKRAAEIFSRDPYAGKVNNVREEGGKILIDAENKQTGQVVSKSYNTKEDMLDDLRAYYSPEMQSKLQAARAEAARKTFDLAPGHTRYGADGKQIVTNPNLTAADARLLSGAGGMRGAGGSGGTGSAIESRENMAVLKSANDAVKQAERFHEQALLKIEPGMKPEDSPAVKLALIKIQQAKFDREVAVIKTATDPVQMAAQSALGGAKKTAHVIQYLNQLGATLGPDFVDQVTASVVQSDVFQQLAAMEKKPGGAPGTTAQATPPANGVSSPAVPWKDRIAGDERQFADAVAKSGWEPYVEKYGVWGGPAYRKPDGNGGWIVKPAKDLAKDLGLQY